MMKSWTLLPALTLILSCTTLNPQQEGTRPVSHETFTSLLQKHVDSLGMVDYEGFMNDRKELKAYLQTLTSNAPNDSNWTSEEQIAYWINLYNAFTIELILRHYPVESIKDIGSSIQIPFVNSPWDIKFIEIADEMYDLNNIEHNILRKNWEEPRVHFAVNCASYSCPKLRKEAYTGEKLDKQLEEQAIRFINDSTYNEISPGKARLSKIFDWYQGDFTKEVSLIQYINRYSEIELKADADISFKDYNWSLNEQD